MGKILWIFFVRSIDLRGIDSLANMAQNLRSRKHVADPPEYRGGWINLHLNHIGKKKNTVSHFFNHYSFMISDSR